MTEQVTGAQALVRALEELDAQVVFGIPGGCILPAYDPLFDSTKVRHILVRHEQGAGHAATGYAQATGRVGYCMATSGPGATNLVTPIADAYMDTRAARRDHRPGALGGDRDRRLPGSRHLRHHDADHEAQLPGPARRRHPADARRGAPHRLDRPARAGAGRHRQGRADVHDDVQLAARPAAARLPSGGTTARQAGAGGRAAVQREAAPGALCRRRRDQGRAPPRSCASSPS